MKPLELTQHSIVGKPARVHSLLVRGKRFSAIGILCLLDTYITTENVNADIFEDFIDKFLIRPFNGSNPQCCHS